MFGIRKKVVRENRKKKIVRKNITRKQREKLQKASDEKVVREGRYRK